MEDLEDLATSQVAERYEYMKRIGSGSFSTVVLLKSKGSGKLYACKIVNREALTVQNIFERFEQEVRVLQSFSHPNIVQVQDLIFSQKFIYFIMEYCENGELLNYLVDNGVPNERDLKKIIFQITSALAYIHSKNIAHRDLKPENILLDRLKNAKLADFGLCHSCIPNQLLQTPCGSPYYAPPEIVNNQTYDGKKGDIWSLGVIIFACATGALPWTEMNPAAVLDQISRSEYTIPESLPAEIKDLIRSCMNTDPSLRPSAEDILKNEWLSSNVSSWRPRWRSFSCESDNLPNSFYSSDQQIDLSQKAAAPPKKALIVRPNSRNRQKTTSMPSRELMPYHLNIRKVPAISDRKK